MVQYVYVVDHDRDVRRSTSLLLRAEGFDCRSFGSGLDFLDSLSELKAGVILMELRKPEIDGFEMIRTLRECGIDWPVIAITAEVDVRVAVSAMKRGAIDVIVKPFGKDLLIEALANALPELSVITEKARRRDTAKAKIDSLSPRELDVLRCLIGGLSNKVIAHRLGLSIRTVEMHRARLMQRLQVNGLAGALAIAIDAGLELISSQEAA